MSEVMVENDLTEFGLRRVHVMAMGKPVELDNYLEYIPVDALDAQQASYQEEDTGTWHLWLYWSAREVVTLRIGSPHGDAGSARPVKAGMWFVEKGGRMSWGIDLAATMYRLRLGRWPERALVRKLPEGTPSTMRVADGSGETTLAVEAAAWVPEQFVVVV